MRSACAQRAPAALECGRVNSVLSGREVWHCLKVTERFMFQRTHNTPCSLASINSISSTFYEQRQVIILPIC